MKYLNEAKKMLLGGAEIMCEIKNFDDKNTNQWFLRVIRIRREGVFYYGLSLSGTWWPIVAITSINGQSR